MKFILPTYRPCPVCPGVCLVGGTVKSTFTHNATGLMMGLRQYSCFAALVSLVHALDDPYFLGMEREG